MSKSFLIQKHFHSRSHSSQETFDSKAKSEDIFLFIVPSSLLTEPFSSLSHFHPRLLHLRHEDFCASPVASLQTIPVGILIAPNRICGDSYTIPVVEPQHAYDTYVQLQGQGTPLPRPTSTPAIQSDGFAARLEFKSVALATTVDFVVVKPVELELSVGSISVEFKRSVPSTLRRLLYAGYVYLHIPVK